MCFKQAKAKYGLHLLKRHAYKRACKRVWRKAHGKRRLFG